MPAQETTATAGSFETGLATDTSPVGDTDRQPDQTATADAMASESSLTESEREAAVASNRATRSATAARSPLVSRYQGSRNDSTPFRAQVIAQEYLSPGLHIEPWAAAIEAYRQAFNASPIYGW
ncbi:MAG: hypothetical protein P4M00_10490 [Azospirillaceae bacterium]|nr:hypothetical protein [Azospirillaceae bacterium]